MGPDDKYVIDVPHPDCRLGVTLIFDHFQEFLFYVAHEYIGKSRSTFCAHCQTLYLSVCYTIELKVIVFEYGFSEEGGYVWGHMLW